MNDNSRPMQPDHHTQELVDLAHGLLAGYFEGRLTSQLKWGELYKLAKFLYDVDMSGQSDELIIKALEKAHAGGMNLQNDRETYFDGVMVLTAMHIKYGQYIRAINYFTEARDNGGALPDWAHIAYALALTYAYPRSALFNPSGFIEALSAVNLADGDTRRKAEAAVRRYLDQGTQLILRDSLKIGEESLSSLADAFKRLGFYHLPEWTDFVHLVETGELLPETPEPSEPDDASMVETEPDETLVPYTEDGPQLGNQALLERLRQLEEENAALKQMLEEQTAGGTERQAEPAREAKVPPQQDYWFTGRRRRLLVFGDNRVPLDKMRRYANAIGFPADDIDFRLDYDRNTGFNLNSLQYSSPYVGILVGPNAHKIVNLGDHSSMIQKLRNEPGFPFVVEIRTHSGELKITKTSFESALRKMMDHAEAISA